MRAESSLPHLTVSGAAELPPAVCCPPLTVLPDSAHGVTAPTAGLSPSLFMKQTDVSDQHARGVSPGLPCHQAVDSLVAGLHLGCLALAFGPS